MQAFQGFLDGALEPEVQRIMLIDGTAVLGWETRRAIEAENSMAAIEEVLRQTMADGTIEAQPTESSPTSSSALLRRRLYWSPERATVTRPADSPE